MRFANPTVLFLAGFLLSAPTGHAETSAAKPAPTGHAETSAAKRAPTAPAEISAAKRALIEELIVHSAGAGTVDGVAEMALAQIAPIYGSLVSEVLDSEPDLNASDREVLLAGMADFEAFAALFLERFAGQVDVREVFAAVYVPLYDRYFEEDELREIAAFYRSEAGRKVLAVMPALGAEGLRGVLPRLQPQILTIVGEVLAERRSAILP
ncbi:MAG: DUF2059 domain-containing protein [Myxococcota bacterium]|nr:DUF2059 domain-containing protein [Myxococcota bacterium]